MNKGKYLFTILTIFAFFVSTCLISFANADEPASDTNIKQSEPSDAKKVKDEKTKTEELLEIIVTGERPSTVKYSVDKTITATKTDTPILEIPQTINIITEDILEDQGATNLHDIWQNVAGAYTSLGGDGFGNIISFRGFSSAHNLSQSVMVNGLRGGRGLFTVSPTLYNISRVDVLKGPASIYGTTQPGGSVNMVTKKPQDRSDNSFSVAGGSFDKLMSHLHSSGPTANKSLFYLFDVGYDISPKLYKNMDKQNIQFISSLAWVIGNNTRLDFESGLSKIDRKAVPAHGLPIANGDPFALPRDFNFTEITDRTNISGYYGEVHFNHDFSDMLKLSIGLRKSHSENENSYHMKLGDPAADGTLKRSYSESSGGEDPLSTDANITWKIDVGENMKNKAIAGFDLTSIRSISKSISATEGVQAINVFNPVYGQVDPSSYKYGMPSKMLAKNLRYGLYLQDEVQLLSKFHLLGGLHFEKFDQDIKNITADRIFSANNDSVTFRGGAVYEIIEDMVSVFSSYSEGYEPQFFDRVMLPTQKGFPWDPEESWQFESGAKYSLKDNLIATLSWFSIRKTNILNVDPEDNTVYETIGAAETAGIELNATGSPIKNLNLSLNYSNLYKAEITEDSDPERIGTRLSGACKHLASAWIRYNIGPLGIGSGISYINGREPLIPLTAETKIEFPDYWLCNAAIYYDLSKNLKLQLNIENVFNKEYLSGIRPTQGAPRNYTFTATTRF